MTTSFPPLPSCSDHLGALIGLVRRELVQAMERQWASEALDLRFTPYLILKQLGLRGPLLAGELARAVDVDGGAMTRQLDHLERRGLLQRRAHEHDRRALRIELTDDGRTLWERATVCNDAVLARAQAALSSAEREALIDGLTRVWQALHPDTTP